MRNVHPSRHSDGVENLLTAVATQARYDFEGGGTWRNLYCSPVGEEETRQDMVVKMHDFDRDSIYYEALGECMGDCGYHDRIPVPHTRRHRVAECASILLDHLQRSVERGEDPVGTLLEIVSR